MKMRTINRWEWAGVGVLTLVALLIFLKLIAPGGWTRLGGFGETFAPRYLPELLAIDPHIRSGSSGYDGQFYAQIAVDPTLRHAGLEDAIDAPAYRARRILLPALAHALALGNPGAAILIYCSLNVFLWFGFAVWLWRWIGVNDARAFARWSTCVLSMGVIESVRYSLTDLASVWLLLACVRWMQEKPLRGYAGYIVAVFLKETNLLALPALLRWAERRPFPWRNWLAGTTVAVATVGVFYLWYLYIHTHFHPFAGVSGNFDWPMASMLRNAGEAVGELAGGNLDSRYHFRLLTMAGLVFQAVWVLSRWNQRADPLLRLAWSYALLLFVLGDLVWWGYWAVCRVVLPMTLVFNLTFAPRRGFWLGILLANLSALHGLYRFL
jgi:hypothetical protein